MSKKVLISGVTGMDGSLMADYLLKNTDYQIFGMVRRSAKPDYSNLENALKDSRFRLVTGDLSDSHSIDNLVKEIKPDYFINFAAQSFVGSSWQIPEQTFDVTAVGVLRCLEAIRKHVPFCRFYNAGSSEEFGDVIYSPQDEAHPLRPQSPYGAAKVSARQIVRVYRNSYNLYAIQGYLFNHEGTRRGEEFVTRKITKGVARITYAIKNGLEFEPIELGNLDARRDWSDAEDFTEGIWKMLNQESIREDMNGFEKNGCGRWIEDGFDDWAKKYYPLRNNAQPNYTLEYGWNFITKNIKEYVLSSNETHTIREFVESAFYYAGIHGIWYGSKENEKFLATTYYGDERKLKSDVLISINPKFYRPAEVSLLYGDSTLAKKELNWKPKVSFQELVSKMIKNDLNDLT